MPVTSLPGRCCFIIVYAGQQAVPVRWDDYIFGKVKANMAKTEASVTGLSLFLLLLHSYYTILDA